MEKLKNIFKNKKIILSMLVFFVVLTIAIGLTYAYFTTTMNGSAGTVSAITAKVGDVEFKASNIEANHIYPGWSSGEKTLTVTLSESDTPVEYVCFLNTTKSEINDLKLSLGHQGSVSHERKLSNVSIKEGLTEIARGELRSEESAITTYELIFPELNDEQNYDMGKSINASISCTLNGTNQVFYSNGKEKFSALATDTNGSVLTVTTTIPLPDEAATQRQELASAGFNLTEEEIKNVKLLDLSIAEDFTETTLTLNVSDIASSGEAVAVYHYDEDEEEWEEKGIYTVSSSGTIDAIFTSLSPVALVKDTFHTYYQKVEYIESTGTQYIDTGILANEIDEAELTLARTGDSSTQYYLGTRNSDGTAIGYSLYFTGHGGVYYYPLTWSGSGKSVAQNVKFITRVEFKNGTDIFYYNDELVNTHSYTQANYNTGNKLYLGAIREINGSANYLSYAKYYSVIMKKNTVEVANYVPCYRKLDNKPGMYDLVEGKFYINKGSGNDFVVGPDVNL